MDELEAFGCDCTTCLLRDKMQDLVSRDLHINNQMAWELEEMSAHKHAYTQGIVKLYSEMREMDEYSCACALHASSLPFIQRRALSGPLRE